MIVPFDELKNYNFTLSDINAICQRPSYRTLRVKSRIYNGFLFIKHGNCQYSFGEHNFTLSSGSIVYLPHKSSHTLTVTSDDFEFYRINFTLSIDGEVALFSTVPTKLTDSATPECVEAIHSLCEDCCFENNTVFKTAKLCTVFYSLQKTSMTARSAKLAPAIHCIHENLSEKFNSKKLADLCYLSTAQFYKLFNSEYSMTPLEYKNRLILDRAVMLFKFYGISISEASSMLGFETPAYFSRFFKKHKGISPNEYIKRNC